MAGITAIHVCRKRSKGTMPMRFVLSCRFLLSPSCCQCIRANILSTSAESRQRAMGSSAQRALDCQCDHMQPHTTSRGLARFRNWTRFRKPGFRKPASRFRKLGFRKLCNSGNQDSGKYAIQATNRFRKLKSVIQEAAIQETENARWGGGGGEGMITFMFARPGFLNQLVSKSARPSCLNQLVSESAFSSCLNQLVFRILVSRTRSSVSESAL